MSDLERSVAGLGVPLDARGLWPVQLARRELAGLSVFERHSEELVDGVRVLDIDRWWAALLSLADASEFVRVATGLVWRDHVRGMENLAALERYGEEGVLPWIASRVDRQGVLWDVPWCLYPCLLVCRSREAFELAASIRGVDSDLDDPPWRPYLDEPDAMLRHWLQEHPDEGAEYLTDADPVAAKALRVLFADDPRGAQRRLRRRLGKNRADRLLADRRIAVPPVAAAVRERLAACPRVDIPRSRQPVTMADLASVFRAFDRPRIDPDRPALRVTGYASRGADGLVFQALRSNGADHSIGIEFTAVGFGGGVHTLDEAEWTLIDAGQLDQLEAGPSDIATVRVRRFEQPDSTLTARRGTNDSWAESLLAAVADRCRSVFLDGRQLHKHLQLGPVFTPLFDWDDWVPPPSDKDIWKFPQADLLVEALRGRHACTTARL